MEEMVTTQTRQQLGASANVKAQIDNTATVAQELTKVVAIAASYREAHKAGEEQATMKEDLTGEVAEVGDNTHELRDRFDTLTELKQ